VSATLCGTRAIFAGLPLEKRSNGHLRLYNATTIAMDESADAAQATHLVSKRQKAFPLR
jgi:hypothetical protein